MCKHQLIYARLYLFVDILLSDFAIVYQVQRLAAAHISTGSTHVRYGDSKKARYKLWYA